MAQAINLQITPSNVMPKIYASQFDIGREIEIILYDGATAYTPPVGTDIRFEGKKPDGNGFSYACTYTGNVVTIVTTAQMTVLAGEIPCELRMSLNGNDIGTLNIIFVIEKSPIDENVPISDTEIPAIVELARDEQYTAEAWATGERNGVPVGPEDPQYHNNAKYWAEHGALDDLTDVEITTPADGDFLQFNGANNEWVNSSDVWDTMAQNGAHNFFDINATVSKYTTTLYERTSTGFRVYNTTSGDYLWMRVPVILPKNTDVVITTDVTRVSGAGIVALRYSEDGNAWTVIDQVVLADSATKVEFTCNTGSHAYYSLWLYCTTATATTGDITYNNIVIRLATDPNTDYTPYAPVNRDCMSYAVNSKLGAHNFCPNNITPQTVETVVVTKDSNDVTHLSGTASASFSLTVASNLLLRAGTYVLSGIPKTSNSEGKYQGIVKYTNGTEIGDGVRDRGSNNNLATFTLASDSYVNVTLSVSAVETNFDYKPMITAVEDTDTTYTPYAMTNRELTEVKIGTPTISSGYSFATGYDNKVYRCGNVVFVNLKIAQYTSTSSRWVEIATLPEGFRPTRETTFAVADDVSGNMLICRIYGSGKINIWSTANTAILPYISVTFIITP